MCELYLGSSCKSPCSVPASCEKGESPIARAVFSWATLDERFVSGGTPCLLFWVAPSSQLSAVFFFFLNYYYSGESERDESEGCTPCKEQSDKERVEKGARIKTEREADREGGWRQRRGEEPRADERGRRSSERWGRCSRRRKREREGLIEEKDSSIPHPTVPADTSASLPGVRACCSTCYHRYHLGARHPNNLDHGDQGTQAGSCCLETPCSPQQRGARTEECVSVFVGLCDCHGKKHSWLADCLRTFLARGLCRLIYRTYE